MSRKALPTALVTAMRERDEYACRKCFSDRYLENHHIVAVQDGGLDELDNLITLCFACHWEWKIVECYPGIDFWAWLKIPNLLRLLALWDVMAHPVAAERWIFKVGPNTPLEMSMASLLEMVQR